MIRSFVLFALIALAVFGAVTLADYPGRVTVDWRGWRIDMSTGILGLLIAIVAVVSVVISRFWGAIRRAPGRFLDMRRVGRHSNRAVLQHSARNSALRASHELASIHTELVDCRHGKTIKP